MALISFCLLLTAAAIYLSSGRDSSQFQLLLQHAGGRGPAVFIIAYILATSCLFPSTPLNLAGGAMFGLWFGLLWCSLAAIIAAVIAFTCTKTVGRNYVSRRLSGRLQMLDARLKRGGKFYIFAVRLLPVSPHGVINYGAGLTSVTFTDYLLGTVTGTALGVLPPVLLGSTGLKAIRTGDILPFCTGIRSDGSFSGRSDLVPAAPS